MLISDFTHRNSAVEILIGVGAFFFFFVVLQMIYASLATWTRGEDSVYAFKNASDFLDRGRRTEFSCSSSMKCGPML
jgi:hypothetical protein